MSPAGFVQRAGAQLALDGQPYRFTGFNAFGIGGGEGVAWTRPQMDTYFAALPVNSMTRTWAFDGYVNTTLLDNLVASAEAAGQKLILTLNNDGNQLVLDGAKNNTWYASGYASNTYVGGAGSWHSWITTVITRYASSPAIGMWEIINEAGISQGADHVLSGTTMKNFYQTVAGWIKAIDPDHLVSTGDVAEFLYAETTGDGGAAQYEQAASAVGVDVLSLHDYELDFGGTTLTSSHFAACKTAANHLQKVIMVGEVGKTATILNDPTRAATIIGRIGSYLAAGAVGVLPWNYSQFYYDDGSGGTGYILVEGDPLTEAIQAYTLPLPMGQLSDPFTTADGALWFGYGSNPTVTSGQLAIVPTGAYPSLTTVRTYDLTAAACTIQFAQAPNVGTGTTAAYFALTLNSSNSVAWYWANGTLFTARTVAGVETNPYTVAYSAVTHAWLRIRESAGTVFWDSSTDGATWTNRASWAYTIPLASIAVALVAGFFGTEPTPGTALFDNLNLPTTVGTPRPPINTRQRRARALLAR